jgi:hypothetical protein
MSAATSTIVVLRDWLSLAELTHEAKNNRMRAI